VSIGYNNSFTQLSKQPTQATQTLSQLTQLKLKKKKLALKKKIDFQKPQKKKQLSL